MAPLTHTMRDLFTKYATTEDAANEKFGTSGAWLHVGSSLTGFTASVDNSLYGAAIAASMDSGYPKRYDLTDSTGQNILAFRSTFGTAVANFDWNEWMVKNSSSTATGTGTAMNRVASAGLGTKTAAQSWQLLAKITIST